MAIFGLRIHSISRGAGRSATAAAAYRAGERIRDERSGRLHNYSGRDDVLYKAILLPTALAGSAPQWARERSALWNAAERRELRRDARIAREFQIALPAELSPPQRLELARRFARQIADRHHVVVDLAVHAPRESGDARNHHAHLLASSREITAAGFGAKAGLDMASAERAQRGLPAGIAEIRAIRASWAQLTNEALAAAGLAARIDHRSLRAQGVDREPRPHIPYAAIQMERRGQRSAVADRIRERYRSRVAARLQGTRTSGAAAPPDLEQVRRQAREAWLALRRETDQPGGTQALQPTHDAKRGPNREFGS